MRVGGEARTRTTPRHEQTTQENVRTTQIPGRPAGRALSVSFYPRHLDILKQRERELNVPRSILLQVLLEIECREALLRRELIARLTHTQPGAVAPIERNP